jgi:phage-related tail protein
MFGRLFSSGTWMAGAITGGLRQLKDTSAYGQGYLNGNQYASRTTHNLTEAFGLMAGLEYGAMLGSAILPGVGTIAGTVLGAVLGERLGDSVGGEVGKLIFESGGQQNLLMAAGK